MANGVESAEKNSPHYQSKDINGVASNPVEYAGTVVLGQDNSIVQQKEVCEEVKQKSNKDFRENTQSAVEACAQNSYEASGQQGQLSDACKESLKDALDCPQRNADQSERPTSLTKSYTLPSTLRGIAGIKRNQKNLFINKMEILSETETDIDEAPALVLGETANDPKTNNEKEFNRKGSKHKVAIPHVPTQPSPRCMMAVCSNHDGRNGGETLEAVLYCGACSATVCYKCAFEKHQEHKVTPVQAAAETIRMSLAERKRKIESTISQLSAKRKSIEANNEDLQQRIHVQFDQVVQRIRKKEAEMMTEIEKMKQKKANLIHGMQSQQETAWGQIDAVLKTQDDVKMLEEYSGLTVINFKHQDSSFSPHVCSPQNGDSFLIQIESNRTTVDLNKVQDEIEKITLIGPDTDSNSEGSSILNGLTPRQNKKRFTFKLDANTAHAALRVSANHTSVEYIGSERNGATTRHVNGQTPLPTSNPYSSKLHGIGMNNGINGKLKRTQFATVIGDSSITQGKQYWEISVNRSMEYRLGVAYKQMQGTKSLADEHNCWALYLSYPDRFSAIHKHHKEYIFVPSHTATQANKVIRIGIFLDYEKGVLSFYNASTAAEKRHLYTFRTFFNRPVWPMLSLRQGKLQILTGLPVPRNLVWKSR